MSCSNDEAEMMLGVRLHQAAKGSPAWAPVLLWEYLDAARLILEHGLESLFDGAVATPQQLTAMAQRFISKGWGVSAD